MPCDVSVVIPSYQSQETIRDAIECALGQNSVDVEVIVVDDASTDGTVGLVEALADPRLRLIRLQANGGTGRARNVGIGAAEGKWIQFLDADDLIEVNKCARQLEQAGDADVVVSDWELVDYGTGKRLRWSGKVKNPHVLEAKIYLSNQIPIHAALVKKSLMDRIGGFVPEIYHEDWEFWIRAVTMGARFKFVPDQLAVYRVKKGSKSYDKIDTKKRNILCLEQIAGQAYAPAIKARLEESRRKLKIDLAAMYYREGHGDRAEETLASLDSPMSMLETVDYRLGRNRWVRRSAVWLPGPRKVKRIIGRWRDAILYRGTKAVTRR